MSLLAAAHKTIFSGWLCSLPTASLGSCFTSLASLSLWGFHCSISLTPTALRINLPGLPEGDTGLLIPSLRPDEVEDAGPGVNSEAREKFIERIAKLSEEEGLSEKS
jgi:hypothetical protein